MPFAAAPYAATFFESSFEAIKKSINANFERSASSSKPSEEKKAAAGHKSGDVWKTSSGIWGAKDSGGNFEYFEDKDKANKYAKKHRAGVKIQEREEWCFAKAAYLRQGESPKWLTIYED